MTEHSIRSDNTIANPFGKWLPRQFGQHAHFKSVNGRILPRAGKERRVP